MFRTTALLLLLFYNIGLKQTISAQEKFIPITDTPYSIKIPSNIEFNKNDIDKEYFSIDKKYSLNELKLLYFAKTINDTIPKEIESDKTTYSDYIKYSKEHFAYFFARKSITGEDNRFDYDEVSGYKKKKFKKVAFIIKSDNLDSFEEKLKPYEQLNPCKKERFINQKISNDLMCTAFAVDNNTVLSAGHPLDQYVNVNELKVVFGFIYTNGTHISKFSKDQIFDIDSIINLNGDRSNYINDYVIIKTKQKINANFILTPNYKKSKKGKPIYTIGHGIRLPLKLSGSAIIKEIDSDGVYQTDLDGLPGNSGSPVFYKNKVIGIYIGGGSYGSRSLVDICKLISEINCGICKVPIRCDPGKDKCSETVLPLYLLENKIKNQ